DAIRGRRGDVFTYRGERCPIIEVEVGPALMRAARPRCVFEAVSGRPRARVAAMTDLDETTDPDRLTGFIALSLLPSWCWLRAAERLRASEAADAVLCTLVDEHWRDQPDYARALRARAREALGNARAAGIAPVAWDSASYPLALTTIVDPPPVLWARGSIDVLNARAVAIVGARAASPYGLSVAERLASDIASAGVVVVSGMARGVDSAAHRGALAAGGTTIAVLGSGVDVIYPPEHAPLAREIAASGAVISELVPGTPPLPLFFPLRNRIISGLCRAVVVIEAGEKSGSLLTPRMALRARREGLRRPG